MYDEEISEIATARKRGWRTQICIDEKYLISLCTGKEVWTLDQLASEFACTRSTIQGLKHQLGLVYV
jgi:hypothetical protein